MAVGKPGVGRRLGRKALWGLAVSLVVVYLLWLLGAGSLWNVGLNNVVDRALADFNRKFSGTVELDSVNYDGSTLVAQGIRLRGEDGQLVASVKSVQVGTAPFRLLGTKWFDLATSGELAVALGDITVTEPTLLLNVGSNGQLNLAGLRMLEKGEPSKVDYLKLAECYSGIISVNRARVVLRDQRGSGYCYQFEEGNLRLRCRRGEPVKLYGKAHPTMLERMVWPDEVASSADANPAHDASSTSSADANTAADPNATSSADPNAAADANTPSPDPNTPSANAAPDPNTPSAYPNTAPGVTASPLNTPIPDTSLAGEGLIQPAPSEPATIVISGQAEIARPHFDLRLATHNWQLAPLLAHPMVQGKVLVKSGAINLDCWAMCRASLWKEVARKVTYGGNVRLDDGGLVLPNAGVALEGINLKVELSRGLVVIKRAVAQLEGMAAQIEGRISLDPEIGFDLTAVVPQLQLKKLARRFALNLPIDGSMRIEVGAEGTASHPQVTGWIKSKCVTVKGQSLKNLEIRLLLQGKLLNIDKISAQAVGGQIEGDGFVLLENPPKVIFRLRGREANLAGLSPVGGYIDSYEVSLAGSVKDPVIYGSSSGIGGFTGQGAMVNSASGRFLYSGHEILLTDAHASTTSGNASLPYAIYDLRNSQIDALVETPGLKIPTVHLAGLGDLGGSLRGQLQVAGSVKDLDSLIVCGVSQGTDITLDGLVLSQLTGTVGMEHTSLVIPYMCGVGAGGNVAASGFIGLTGNPSSLFLSGSGVRIEDFINVVDYHIPLLIGGNGDVGLNWSSGGRHTNNWVTLFADSQGGTGVSPFLAAAYGYAGPQGIGYVGYASGLGLEPIRATRDLTLAGDLTGQVGVWGLLSDVQFAFNGQLSDGPFTGVSDDSLYASGIGSYKDHKVFLNRSVVAWDYARARRPLAASSSLSGSAVPWLGPVLGQRLQEGGRLLNPMPDVGVLSVSGWAHAGAPLDYRIAFGATGVDLGWLNNQAWLPEARQLAALGNVSGGFANAGGVVYADAGRPRIEHGTWIEVPWLLAGMGGDARTYSMVGKLSSGPNTRQGMGAINLEPVVIANRAFEDTLPVGRRILTAYPTADSAFPVKDDGLTAISGTIAGSVVDLDLSSKGWNTKELMSFLPEKVTLNRNLLSGNFSTERLHLGVDSQAGFLNSLELEGKVALQGCFVSVGEQRVPLDSIVANVSRTRDRLILDDLCMTSGPLAFAGRGERDANGRWLADLWSQDFPLEYLSYWHPTALRLSGAGRAAVRVVSDDSAFKDVRLYVGFEGQDIGYRSRPESLRFPSVRLGGLEAAPEGGYRATEELGVEIANTPDGYRVTIPEGGLYVSAFRDIAAPDPFLSVIKASGTVGFRSAALGGGSDWFFGPNGPDFGTTEQSFRVEGQNIQGNTIRALLGVAPSTRRFTFSGAANLRGQWYRDHQLDADINRLRYAGELTALELGRIGSNTSDWSGLTLSHPFSAVYSRTSSEGRLLVEPFEMVPNLIGGASSTTRPGAVRGEADILLTRDPALKGDPTGHIGLNISNLHTSDLSSILPGNGSLGIISNLAFEASGPVFTPAFSLALDVANGNLGPLRFDSLRGTVQGDLGQPSTSVDVAGQHESPDQVQGNYVISLGDGVRLDFSADKGKESWVEVRGRLPLTVKRGGRLVTREQTAVASSGAASKNGGGKHAGNASTRGLVPIWQGLTVDSGGEVELVANLRDAGLNLLKSLVPGVEETGGAMNGELRFGGSLKHPEVTGHLNIAEGRVVHQEAGTLSGLNVAASFRELDDSEVRSDVAIPANVRVSRVSLDKFSGMLGGAPFSAEGFADMAGFVPTAMKFALRGEDLPLKWGSLFSGLADVKLEVEERPGWVAGEANQKLFPVLTGDVHVKSGTLALGLDSFSSGEGAFDWSKLPLDYQVRLNMDDDVWVQVLGCRVRAAGELWVVPDEQTKQPVMAGSVDLSRGVLEIPLYDVSFRLRSGRATFESSNNPVLENVMADASVSGYEVTAYVSGAYPDIKLEFVSSPPLAEKEIQRLLALGGMGTYSPTQGGSTYNNPANVPGYGSDYASSQLSVGNQGLAMLGRLVASPITSQIGKMLFLSDFSFDVSPPHGYSIKLAKALDRRDRILFTLTRTLKTDTGKDESVYGLEWRFKPTLMVRLGVDQNGAIRPWFQGLWEF